jgi:hypothetical protein
VDEAEDFELEFFWLKTVVASRKRMEKRRGFRMKRRFFKVETPLARGYFLVKKKCLPHPFDAGGST